MEWKKDKYSRNLIAGLFKRKIVIFIISLFLLSPLFLIIRDANQMVVCDDVSQFGHYTGTGANNFVRNYINSFFPEQIEAFCSDVQYMYKAAGRNNYDFEAYLEFTITDPGKFCRYVDEIAPKEAWETFFFDTEYKIYSIENRFDIHENSMADKESLLYYPIECARIRSVLYHTETQTIIFWALGVYDGGGIGTNFLNTFFRRFGIDPVAYEKTANTPYGIDPFALD